MQTSRQANRANRRDTCPDRRLSCMRRNRFGTAPTFHTRRPSLYKTAKPSVYRPLLTDATETPCDEAVGKRMGNPALASSSPMRNGRTIDDQPAKALTPSAHESRTPLDAVVHQTLKAGLTRRRTLRKRARYRITPVSRGGIRSGIDLDKALALFDQIEGRETAHAPADSPIPAGHAAATLRRAQHIDAFIDSRYHPFIQPRPATLLRGGS